MKTYLKILAIVLFVACSTSSNAPAPTSETTASIQTLAFARPRPPTTAPIAPTVETRSIAQIAQAACAGNRCKGSQVTTKLLGASGDGPILPPSWSVSGWFVDPANSTTCASNTNSGTAATCTGGCSGSTCPSGIGPLLTYQEILVHRWGCLGNPSLCPRWRQSTTVTYVSNETNASDVVNCGSAGCDPVYLKPALENAANGLIQCTLSVAWTGGTGTFTVNSAKNRSTPQLLQATVPVGGAVGQVLINTTHASHALIYTNVSGNEWNISQPLLIPAIPFNVSTVTEVNSWATNDTVTGNTQSTINLADVEPIIIDSNASATNGIFINQCAGSDPLAPSFADSLVINQNVSFVDSTEARDTFVQPMESINSWFDVFAFTDSATLTKGSGAAVLSNTHCNNCLTSVIGGFLGGQAVGSFYLDGDVIVASSSQNVATGHSLLAQIYIETGATLEPRSADVNVLNVGLGGPFLWGPGIIALEGVAHMTYPSGATAGVTAFLQKGAFAINGQTKTCIAVPGAGTSFGTCNIVLSAANLDGNLGATTGCLAVGGGASVCNTAN